MVAPPDAPLPQELCGVSVATRRRGWSARSASIGRPGSGTRHGPDPKARPVWVPFFRTGYAIDSMFLVTTSIVSFNSAVGLNSTISVSGKISGVWPGPT